MSLFIFLTVVQAIVAALLVVTILMQKSEGGGLGVGGSPAGFMSARGAADFMTRATTVLATAFVVLSIALATLAVGQTSGRQIDTSLERAAPLQNAPAVDPLAPAQGGAAPAAAPVQQPAAPAPANDPLSGAAGQ
ncbi:MULTISPECIES: preprotein translocase subunit SecG [unclassified Novosphingobium]|uniref:preprotein translocase subunit SecG n=1 Tax=unclassified Novosphingobium TaxID=2644732 RepID=UPI0025E74246|nr:MULTISPECIES: preprotein translocase subunit SecG [unclassified Novosphingobium]